MSRWKKNKNKNWLMDNLNNFGFFILSYKEKNFMFYLHEDFGFL